MVKIHWKTLFVSIILTGIVFWAHSKVSNKEVDNKEDRFFKELSSYVNINDQLHKNNEEIADELIQCKADLINCAEECNMNITCTSKDRCELRNR